MLRRSDIKKFCHAWTAIVFRSLVIDRAGCLPQCHVVVAQTVEGDVFGTAILLSYGGHHFQFPISSLHPITHGIIESLRSYRPTADAIKRLKAEQVTLTGGQELTWDIHNAVEPAKLRHLILEEIVEAVADTSALSRSTCE
ncbi:hypothetical protein [Novipirellula rosea]|uniref:Uncharacterized protein n=1 Tax=Novipirellula rosea TaxID=1031540 RepID=A0ABP8MJ89_9BACT